MKRRLTRLSEWIYLLVVGITLLTLLPKIYEETYWEFISYILGLIFIIFGAIFIADKEGAK